ncbi:hypothetical protein MCOR02_005219 [Pyricularia oryzae]|nr:hypothetical protein MCOR02_005219 [Pyricularia oryzae]KAI6476283.1 hypothetical protein MCOR13_011835 [Pyricularia oryzae]KAI6623627.1 hypothetical protein MCOR14_009484 [Pyricularia oryzae]
MAGPRKSPRLHPEVPTNTAPQNAAPQDTTPQSDGKSIDAAKEKHGSKRKADTQDGNSGKDLRAPKIQRLESSNSPASLGIPSIVTNSFPEDAPMIGTSVSPAANLFDHQGPTKSTHEQEPYYVDKSHFEETFTSVTSLTEAHAAPAISDANRSPAVKTEPPSPQARSRSPFMFADGENTPQDPASAQKQPQYDQARSYPTPSPDPYDNAGQAGTSI